MQAEAPHTLGDGGGFLKLPTGRAATIIRWQNLLSCVSHRKLRQPHCSRNVPTPSAKGL